MIQRISLFLISLTLVACGSSGSAVSCDRDYWDGEVGTCIPEGWEILDSETLAQRGVPEETIVAFQAKESVSGQFPTVAITREKLASVTDPLQYSDASVRSIEVVEGYEHVDTKDVSLAGTDVRLHIFTAQPIDGEPRRKFFQASTTHGDVGYTVTGVSPVSIDKTLENQLLIMIEQLTFEEQKTES